MTFDRSTLQALLVAGGALLYGASPIDVVPELLTGPLGLGDDAVVMAMASFAILRILMKARVRRRAATSAPTA